MCEVAEGRVEELTAKIVAIQEKHRLQNKGGLIFKAEPDILSAWAELPKAKEIDYNDISIIIDQIDENFEISEQEAYAI